MPKQEVIDCGLDERDNVTLDYADGSELVLIRWGRDYGDWIHGLLLYSKESKNKTLSALAFRRELLQKHLFWSNGRVSQPNLAEYWDSSFEFVRRINEKLETGEITSGHFKEGAYSELIDLIKTDLALLNDLRANVLKVVPRPPTDLPFVLPVIGHYVYRGRQG